MFYNSSSRSGGGFTRSPTMATSSRTSLVRSSVPSHEQMDVDDLISPSMGLGIFMDFQVERGRELFLLFGGLLFGF